MVHCRFIKVQSARISWTCLAVVQLGIKNRSTTLKWLITIHVKKPNLRIFVFCFLFYYSVMSRFFLEITRWRQFRKGSAVSRKLSYPHWSDSKRTLSFHFSGPDWLRRLWHFTSPHLSSHQFTSLHFSSFHFTCMTAIYVLLCSRHKIGVTTYRGYLPQIK